MWWSCFSVDYPGVVSIAPLGRRRITLKREPIIIELSSGSALRKLRKFRSSSSLQVSTVLTIRAAARKICKRAGWSRECISYLFFVCAVLQYDKGNTNTNTCMTCRQHRDSFQIDYNNAAARPKESHYRRYKCTGERVFTAELGEKSRPLLLY